MSTDVPPSFVCVEVSMTETMYTRVDRDVWDEFYTLPEPLVVAYEDALKAFRAAEAAIDQYIETNQLQPEETP